MIDLFENYTLQREELLARIAQELQLNKTRLMRMESAYNALAEFLKNDNDFFEDLEIEVYAQGSKRIGTTVRPINNEDFDLDVVLHIYDPYYNHTPEQVYSALVNSLRNNEHYKYIMEKKKRCVRLNYKSDFHMDILPACMPNNFEKEKIKIPEKALRNWSSGNPKGYSSWFLGIADSVKEPILRKYAEELLESQMQFKAQVEKEDLPKELYFKTPLQRSVQLLKRYRDIYYENRDYRLSSIVITTLAARLYQGEDSIFDAINNIAARISSSYIDSVNGGYKFKVLNPVNPEEDFTDSWTDKHYESFYDFISDFSRRWRNLVNSFETSKEDYIKLFGEGVYKKSLEDQFQVFYKSTNNNLAKSSGQIIGGVAFTNSKGTINTNTGLKNGTHHNFGGNY